MSKKGLKSGRLNFKDNSMSFIVAGLLSQLEATLGSKSEIKMDAQVTFVKFSFLINVNRLLICFQLIFKIKLLNEVPTIHRRKLDERNARRKLPKNVTRGSMEDEKPEKGFFIVPQSYDPMFKNKCVVSKNFNWYLVEWL